jgi:uncharacterized Zn finger protein (UPF0148 family)
MITGKVCSKCGGMDFYDTGARRCKTCQRRYMQKLRDKDTRKARDGQPRTTRVRHNAAPRVPQTDTATDNALSLDAEAAQEEPQASAFFGDAQERIRRLVERHEQTMRLYDEQRARIKARIAAAERDGIMVDVKHYEDQLRKVVAEAAAYDLKMSDKLAFFVQFLEPREESAPIYFVVQQPQPSQVVTPPTVALPDGATEKQTR